MRAYDYFIAIGAAGGCLTIAIILVVIAGAYFTRRTQRQRVDDLNAARREQAVLDEQLDLQAIREFRKRIGATDDEGTDYDPALAEKGAAIDDDRLRAIVCRHEDLQRALAETDHDSIISTELIFFHDLGESAREAVALRGELELLKEMEGDFVEGMRDLAVRDRPQVEILLHIAEAAIAGHLETEEYEREQMEKGAANESFSPEHRDASAKLLILKRDGPEAYLRAMTADAAA
jgi:hypothetical protein